MEVASDKSKEGFGLFERRGVDPLLLCRAAGHHLKTSPCQQSGHYYCSPHCATPSWGQPLYARRWSLMLSAQWMSWE